MFYKLLKKLVDLVYMTGRARKKYERDNPDDKVFAADASKGVVKEENKEIQRGLDWVTSQRAVILLTDKKIVCGKWTILLDDISDTQLIKYGSGQVLKIQTKDGTYYQFGMQINPEWTNQQILPLKLEKGQVKYSLFSIIVRLILLLYLIYWLYRLFVSS